MTWAGLETPKCVTARQRVNDIPIISIADTTFSLYSNRTNVSFLTVQESFVFYNCPVVSK